MVIENKQVINKKIYMNEYLYTENLCCLRTELKCTFHSKYNETSVIYI